MFTFSFRKRLALFAEMNRYTAWNSMKINSCLLLSNTRNSKRILLLDFLPSRSRHSNLAHPTLKEMKGASKATSGNIMDRIKEGDLVEYKPTGASATTSVGRVAKILTHDTVAGSTKKHIKADEQHPSICHWFSRNGFIFVGILIRNENTHKETAYKPENVVKILEE